MKFVYAISLSGLLILSVFSCGNKNEKPASASNDSTQTAQASFDTKNFEREYFGSFGDGHIVIVLSYVQGKNVSGYNVHKGLRRNIKGNISESNGEYRFVLSEPGDNKYDGVFEFTINPQDFTGKGNWTPNKKDVVSAKSFELKQRIRNEESENKFVGYWDGPDMLKVSSDGMAELEYYQSGPKLLRGQWLAEENTISIEWPKNAYTKGSKYQLTYKQEEDGYYALTDKSKKLEYYQYIY